MQSSFHWENKREMIIMNIYIYRKYHYISELNIVDWKRFLLEIIARTWALCTIYAFFSSLIVIVCVFLRMCPAAFQLLFVTKVFSVFFPHVCTFVVFVFFFWCSRHFKNVRILRKCTERTHIRMNEMVRRPVRIICTSFHCCYDYLRLLNERAFVSILWYIHIVASNTKHSKVTHSEMTQNNPISTWPS